MNSSETLARITRAVLASRVDQMIAVLKVGFASTTLLFIATPSSAQSDDTLRLLPRSGESVTLDPNGFLFNPRWLNGARLPDIEKRCGFRAETGALEVRRLVVTKEGPCLSERERTTVSLNEASGTLILGTVCQTSDRIGKIRGHVNWVPMTATGLLQFETYSGDPPLDGDININVATVDDFALTEGNHALDGAFAPRRALHTESYYQETLGRLHASRAGWWNALRYAMKDSKRMHNLVDERFAIITGLYGVDGVHRFQAELHPVFGMAILISSDPVRGEQWALMVRNQGNEGDCSSGQHVMHTLSDLEQGPIHGDHQDQDYVVDLGWWAQASDATVALDSSWSSHSGHAPAYVADATGGHLYIVLNHPRPAAGKNDFLFLGTIWVKWTSQSAGTSTERLQKWMPTGLRPKLTDVGAAEDGKLVRSIRTDRVSAVPLSPPPRLSALRTVRTEVRAEPNLPVASHQRAGDECRLSDRGGMCQNAVRVALGYSGNIGHSAFIGAYVYPNTWSLDWDNRLAEYLSFFSIMGYRFDFRRDRFRKMPDEFHPVGDVYEGWTTRASMVLSPNTAHIKSWLAITPYTMATVGASFMESPDEREKLERLTWGWGLGAQISLFKNELFVEGQNQLLRSSVREDAFGRKVGGFEGHFALSTGVMFCIWPICR